MSLDVYLEMEILDLGEQTPKIYARKNGCIVEITREEWDKTYPGIDPYTILGEDNNEVFWSNITHNLAPMAVQADIYKHLWRPEEINITRASELIEPLESGLTKLQADPAYFRKFNPPNGWGNYEMFVQFVESYLDACKKWPKAVIRVSR